MDCSQAPTPVISSGRFGGEVKTSLLYQSEGGGQILEFKYILNVIIVVFL